MDPAAEIQALLDALPPQALALIAAIGIGLILWLLLRIIFVQLDRMVAKTSLRVDSILMRAVRMPSNLVILCVAVLVYRAIMEGLQGSEFAADGTVGTAIRVFFILALILFIDRFSTSLLGDLADRSDALRSSRSIVQGVTHGVVLGIGALVLLGTLGISVTPIIASLGITSLAVALALQPTLENFFSGVQLVVDKPIRVGDFIELDSGEQGFVDRIGWRSTWIRMLPNNTVIMPNSVLAQSKIINYFYPSRELSVPVELGVHYTSDLEHVERVTLEVAREVLRTHEWGVTEYETFVVYTGFGDSSIDFTVMLRAKEYFNRFWVRSAFIKALHRRYAQEGINIPFPIRAINTSQEAAVLPVVHSSE